jgi:hypothetical protein
MSSSFAALKSKKAVLHQVGSLCTLVNQILVFWKDLKFKSLAIKRLEIPKTYWFCFVWRKKIVDNSYIFKVSSGRTHIRVLHRTLVHQILVYRKELKFKSFALIRLETPMVYWFCFVWRKKIVDNSCMFKVSSDRTYTHDLHHTLVNQILVYQKDLKRCSLKKIVNSKWC